MTSAEPISLKEETDQSLSEARIILPGIQALLGFQTMAVFNQRFEDLSVIAQHIHLISLLLIILSTVLAMTPAAMYRTASIGMVTRRFLRMTTLFLNGAMISLSLALCLDSYVVTTLVFNSLIASVLFAVCVLILCWVAWFLFPFRLIRSGKD